MGNRHAEIEEGFYKKWLEWIERVYREVVNLFLYRSFYRRVAEITQANDAIPPSSFFDALGAWYATTQAMAVRRQTDTDRKAVSLARLLENMAEHPQVMSRERHVEIWTAAGDEEHWRERGSQEYDKFAGAGSDQIPKERYEADLKCFQDAAQPIKDYVDRLVAHNDQRELEELPTYEDLNGAIEILEELLNKYMVLLKSEGVPNADPVHQEDWARIFRVPWLRD
jgi:hypothetical protein